jgi:hypothetical protein
MVILPYPPRRAWLRSFALVMGLTGGLLTGVLLSLPVSPRWSASGVFVALVLALPGLLWPQTVSIPYRVWNKLAREFTRCARLWLTGICFYIAFVAVGRLGSSLRLARPTADGSLWVPRQSGAPTAYGSPHGVVTAEASQGSWVSAFVSWAVRSGNGWACCLLPFMALLSVLEPAQENGNVPADIYTLY